MEQLENMMKQRSNGASGEYQKRERDVAEFGDWDSAGALPSRRL
jgi:hypothetical protein